MAETMGVCGTTVVGTIHFPLVDVLVPKKHTLLQSLREPTIAWQSMLVARY